MLFPDLERTYRRNGTERIAGVDEAGRGPLAGPVTAAAAMFHPGTAIPGVADSKALTAEKREELFIRIQDEALAFHVGSAGPSEIDDYNILQASILAMHRAIDGLQVRPDLLLVDGNCFHHPTLPFQTIVKGDAKCFSIAAASILAKVTRDRVMAEYDDLYPEYGFRKHKGYPTPEHVAALLRYGPCPIHRSSFHYAGKESQLRLL